MSTAGDVNGDGYDDILVGSPAAGTLSQGYAYLMFGGGDLPERVDLETEISGTSGVVFQGAITGEKVLSHKLRTTGIVICLQIYSCNVHIP